MWSLAESSDEHVALVPSFIVMTSYTRHPSYFDLAYMKIAGIEEHHQIESTYNVRIMFASNKQLSLGTC